MRRRIKYSELQLGDPTSTVIKEANAEYMGKYQGLITLVCPHLFNTTNEALIMDTLGIYSSA